MSVRRSGLYQSDLPYPTPEMAKLMAGLVGHTNSGERIPYTAINHSPKYLGTTADVK